MSTEYDSLTKRRGGVKSSLTHFKTFLNKYKQLSERLNDVQIICLKERIHRLQDVFIEFKDIQGEIESIVEVTKVDEQYAERLKFEDSYFEVLAEAKNMLGKNINDDQHSSHSQPVSSVSASNPNQVNPQKIAVKLPDIKLPTFNGSFDGWLEFRDTFESLINQNADLSGIQRYHYLRASLEGKAAEVIKSIEFSEQGYYVAWDALVDRFNNKK